MVYVVIAIALISSPLWVPILFLCQAIAQRRFSLEFLFLFMTAEAISLGVAQLTLWGISGFMRED